MSFQTWDLVYKKQKSSSMELSSWFWCLLKEISSKELLNTFVFFDIILVQRRDEINHCQGILRKMLKLNYQHLLRTGQGVVLNTYQQTCWGVVVKAFSSRLYLWDFSLKHHYNCFVIETLSSRLCLWGFIIEVFLLRHCFWGIAKALAHVEIWTKGSLLTPV